VSILRRISRLPVLSDIAEARRILRARRSTGFVMESAPGHFGSPIPALKDIRSRENEVFRVPSAIAGVDLHERQQLELVARFAELYADQPFTAEPTAGNRYYFDNSLFSYGDALMLHCLLRHFRPQRLVEVGSGFSSAVILDTDDLFLDESLKCTFIDPYPQRLRGLLRADDAGRQRVVVQPVQAVPLELFGDLGSGDVLFIDSSHVSKVGSDVNHLVFEVLPRLAPGVFVHVHDVFFPFEYPRQWIYQGRAWNENYLVRAFLMFNSAFEIVLFNSYLAQFHADEVEAHMPLWAKKPGGSLWLRRVGPG
jgi:methyltransferase family protein